MATTTFYMSAISVILQYFQNLGLMDAGGFLFTNVGGSVGTPVTTYTDSTGLVANPNPMTLNSAGRPASASGAPVAFWVPGGTTVQLIVQDSSGNQLVFLDNVPAINDLTNSNNALQALLASAASSNPSGSGPVAGADLVANAVKSYDVIADVRAANVPVLASGQTLSIELQGGVAVGDGLGGFFYWSAASAAADDGRTVLQPTRSAGAGRWLRYYPLGVEHILNQGSNLAITSSTVLTASSITAALSAGLYRLSLRALVAGAGGTGQGYQLELNWSGSLGASPNIGELVSSANGSVTAGSASINSAIAVAAISNTVGDFANAEVLLNASTSGTLTLQVAQNSSSGNSTTLSSATTLSIVRIA